LGSLIQVTITSELVVQSGKNKVSLTRGYSQEFKFDITFMIWVNFGVMTFWPIFWPWNWPRGSKYKCWWLL